MHTEIGKSRILIFTATYNEAENISKFIHAVHNILPKTDILVVDDSSPDGTGDLLKLLASSNPYLKIIHRANKSGLGTAHLLALRYAMINKYDTLVTMDADLSHDPLQIPSLMDKLSKFDVVIGSRYMNGGVCDYSGYRRLVSVQANFFARNLLKINLHEFTTSFRAFNVDSLSKVNFTKMHNTGYSFFMESIYRYHQSGLSIGEVPIHFKDRTLGVSKIPKLEIVRGIFKLLHLYISKNIRTPIKPEIFSEIDFCGCCGSKYLAERYLSNLGDDRSSEAQAYKCSSMGHKSKPRVVKCLECGLTQVPMSMHPKDLEGLYSNVVDADYLEIINVKSKTFKHSLKLLLKHVKPTGKLLEVGSYCGLFLNEAQKKGFDVTGVEPSIWAAEYAQKTFNLNIVNENFESAVNKIESKFDVVTSWDVIEHVRNPREFLRLANKLMFPGGVIALSTIDIDSWFPKLLKRNWPWIMEMHLYYFGNKTLERMLTEEGFEVVEVAPYRHYASLKYAFKKLCSILPPLIANNFVKLDIFIPNFIIPITLGDIKIYIACKR